MREAEDELLPVLGGALAPVDDPDALKAEIASLKAQIKALAGQVDQQAEDQSRERRLTDADLRSIERFVARAGAGLRNPVVEIRVGTECFRVPTFSRELGNPFLSTALDEQPYTMPEQPPTRLPPVVLEGIERWMSRCGVGGEDWTLKGLQVDVERPHLVYESTLLGRGHVVRPGVERLGIELIRTQRQRPPQAPRRPGPAPTG